VFVAYKKERSLIKDAPVKGHGKGGRKSVAQREEQSHNPDQNSRVETVKIEGWGKILTERGFDRRKGPGGREEGVQEFKIQRERNGPRILLGKE